MGKQLVIFFFFYFSLILLHQHLFLQWNLYIWIHICVYFKHGFLIYSLEAILEEGEDKKDFPRPCLTVPGWVTE